MRRRIIVLLCALFFVVPTEIFATAEETPNYPEWIRVLDIYRDYPQVNLEEMETKIDLLMTEADSEFSERKVTDLIGQASYREQTDRGVYLQYYSIGSEESIILTVQLYLSAEELIASQNEEGSQTLPQPTLRVVDIQRFSNHHFQPMVESYREFMMLSRQDELDWEELVNMVGHPDNQTYDFVSQESRYEWFYLTEDENDIDYIYAIVDGDSQVIELGIPEKLYEQTTVESEETTEIE